MDIVSRLKEFIELLGIPVTQFADNCRIPRPTLSQLLNGRNKTVRDELISKIHEAYPQLNVMWFMFGEGEPILGDSPLEATGAVPNVVKREINEANDREGSRFGSTQEPIEFSLDMLADTGENPRLVESKHHATSPMVNDTAQNSVRSNASKTQRTISFDALGESVAGKRIVNIIVYYSDHSFQSFIPDPNPSSSFPIV